MRIYVSSGATNIYNEEIKQIFIFHFSLSFIIDNFRELLGVVSSGKKVKYYCKADKMRKFLAEIVWLTDSNFTSLHRFYWPQTLLIELWWKPIHFLNPSPWLQLLLCLKAATPTLHTAIMGLYFYMSRNGAFNILLKIWSKGIKEWLWQHI